MWIADQWKDYEVLDPLQRRKAGTLGRLSSRASRSAGHLEYPRKNPGWKKKTALSSQLREGGGEWEFFNLPEEWSIHYRELTFRLKPFSFKHTGLFRNRQQTGTGLAT